MVTGPPVGSKDFSYVVAYESQGKYGQYLGTYVR
jgi:hypothetical protein